jgi:hypothetical protein
MTGVLTLGGLLLAGFAFLSLMLAFALVIVKSIFWLVFLPLRLLFWAVGAAFMLVGTGIAMAAAVLFGLVLLIAPLLPLILLGALIYGVVKLVQRPATA